MKINTAFKILITACLLSFVSFTNIQAQSGDPFEGSTTPITVNGKVDMDIYSLLSVSPSFVEIKQPSTVTLTLLNPNGTPKNGKNIQIYIEGDSTGITISQPSPTNTDGETTGSVSSSVSGTYKVCAKDTTESFDIFLLDCESIYVTPVPVPSIYSEPPYTKGTSNSVLWDTSGTLSYQYLAQASKTSSFSSIAFQSDWIGAKGYNFQSLENGQIYFYRVKARNIYGGESAWSSYVFSVQDSSGPEITILDISDIGENNTSQWDPEYEITIRYRIKDNVEVLDKNFWCLKSDSSKDECTYTNSTSGDIWEIGIQLKEFEILEGNLLLNNYFFCVESSDLVGNITRNCDGKITVPTPPGEEEPKPPVTPVTPTPQIPEIIKEVGEKITEVIDNTIGKLEPIVVQDSSVTFTAANVAVGFSVLLGGLTSLPYFLFQIILALLSLLGFRKKGNVSGYVYDSVTKEPISQAIVRVYNESNELVWTDVTNGNGYFTSIEMEDAEYSIKVSARNYTFPSKIVFGKTDFPLENVYHGEDFLSKGNKIPDYSIPLDLVEISRLERIFQKFLSRTKYLWKSLHIVLFIAGLLFSIYALTTTPVWWNYLIVCLYIPALIALFVSFFGNRQKYGTVRDEKKNRLPDVIVGLKEDEFDKLVSKRVTDSKGEYRFVVNKGVYSVVILNSDLKIQNTNGLSHMKVEGNGMNIVCPNIVVKKLEDSTKEDVVEPLEEL